MIKKKYYILNILLHMLPTYYKNIEIFSNNDELFFLYNILILPNDYSISFYKILLNIILIYKDYPLALKTLIEKEKDIYTNLFKIFYIIKNEEILILLLKLIYHMIYINENLTTENKEDIIKKLIFFLKNENENTKNEKLIKKIFSIYFFITKDNNNDIIYKYIIKNKSHIFFYKYFIFMEKINIKNINILEILFEFITLAIKNILVYAKYNNISLSLFDEINFDEFINNYSIQYNNNFFDIIPYFFDKNNIKIKLNIKENIENIIKNFFNYFYLYNKIILYKKEKFIINYINSLLIILKKFLENSEKKEILLIISNSEINFFKIFKSIILQKKKLNTDNITDIFLNINKIIFILFFTIKQTESYIIKYFDDIIFVLDNLLLFLSFNNINNKDLILQKTYSLLILQNFLKINFIYDKNNKSFFIKIKENIIDIFSKFFDDFIFFLNFTIIIFNDIFINKNLFTQNIFIEGNSVKLLDFLIKKLDFFLIQDINNTKIIKGFNLNNLLDILKNENNIIKINTNFKNFNFSKKNIEQETNISIIILSFFYILSIFDKFDKNIIDKNFFILNSIKNINIKIKQKEKMLKKFVKNMKNYFISKNINFF